MYVREQLKCLELCLGMGDASAEILWVRMSGQISIGDVVVGVLYRPLDQEEADEAFFRQLEQASHSQVLVLM